MIKGLVAGSALLLAGGAAVSAATIDMSAEPQAHVILVAGGCGPAFHRNPFGACVPNRFAYVYGAPVVRLPPPCPRFYHRDPDPARPLCYPNF